MRDNDHFDAEEYELRLLDQLTEWQRRAFWCCDGIACACGGLTVAQVLEREEQERVRQEQEQYCRECDARYPDEGTLRCLCCGRGRS